VENLAWFPDQLELSCPKELQTNTPIATDTLTSAFCAVCLRHKADDFFARSGSRLMYDTACQVDPATNSYCYIEAAQNQNPSDMYLYQLPINIAFSTRPENTNLDLMSLDSLRIQGLFPFGLE
jgi:hypothetical protein